MLLRNYPLIRGKKLAFLIFTRALATNASDGTTPSLSSSQSDAPQRLAQQLDYCAKIVEERDYENFVAAMLMPAPVQPVIISMLALNAEVAIVRQKIKRNSGVTGIYQLQFWRDALRVWARQQKGMLPRQPAIECLKAFGTPHKDVDLMLKLVEARQATLGDRPFKTLADLDANSVDVFGSLMRLWANALARNGQHDSVGDAIVSSTSFNSVVDHIAKAVGIAMLLRSTLPLLKTGVVLLPEEAMSAHALNPDIIFNNREPDALRRMARDLCQVSIDYLDAARARQAEVAPRVWSALLSSAFRADYYTRVLRDSKHDLFATRLQQRPTFTTWRLWWRHRRRII